MSIAEKLREAAAKRTTCGNVDRIALALTDVSARCEGLCSDCTETWYKKLANAIEAEQTGAVAKALIEEVAKAENIGIGLLHDVAKDLEEYAQMTEGATSEDLDHYAGLIRNALRGAKPQLPEGIEWPRFEDGELVRFGDRFVDRDGVAKKVTDVHFYEDKVFVGPCDRYKYGEPVKRPEREVLDADGVPIKVGDTVYYTQPSAYTEGERIVDTIVGKEVCFTNGYWANPAHLTHRKPDTQEAIDGDCWLDAKEYCEKYNIATEWPKHYGKAKCEHLLARQRKLLGGGQ